MHKALRNALLITIGVILALVVVLWISIDKAGSESAAAWVQAIGAIIGLIVAIGVPAWIKFQENREKRIEAHLKATSLAITILPSLDVWASKVHALAEKCEKAKCGDTNYASVSLGARSVVDIPKPLHARLDQLHGLGDLAIDIQKAVVRQRWLFDNSEVFRAASLVKRIEDPLGGFQLAIPDRDQCFLDRWIDTLLALNQDLDHAQGALRKWLGCQVKFDIPLLGPGGLGD